MKKTRLFQTVLFFLLGSLTLISCKKDALKTTFEDEISNELRHIHMPSSDYEMDVSQPLTRSDDHKYYTAGMIEYKVNGEVLATVDFGNGEKDAVATVDKKGVKSDIDLQQKGKPSEYKKVVVEPLVFSDGCGFIVSGIIEYYKGDEWVATIDFGDGTCDEIAEKTTWKGDHITFHISLFKD